MSRRELLDLWIEFGIEKEIDMINTFPELLVMEGFKLDNNHFDLLHHSMNAFLHSNSNKDFVKLACLFHDIGKCYIDKFQKNGEIDLNGHHILSSKVTKNILSDLEYNKETIDKVIFLINSHEKDWENFTEKQLKRFVKELEIQGLSFYDFYELQSANHSAKNIQISTLKLKKLSNLYVKYHNIYNLDIHVITYENLNFSERDIESDTFLSSLNAKKYLLDEIHSIAKKYHVNNKYAFFNILYNKYK